MGVGKLDLGVRKYINLVYSSSDYEICRFEPF